MKQIFIIKANGTKRRFSYKKLLESIKRSGAAAALADEIARSVLKKLPLEVTTNQIYDLIYQELKNYRQVAVAQVYSLRWALSQLDPEIWERYIGKLFAYYNYQVEWNKIIPGEAVEHQVDVVATKGKRQWLIECKHHYDQHSDTGLGEILQVWARLKDIQAGHKRGLNRYNFTGAWLVVNTKFSEHAKRYAVAKKINLSGWRYPEQYSLERLIQDQNIFPVTVLNLDKKTRDFLLQNDLITIQDVANMSDRFVRLLDKRVLSKLFGQINDLLAGEW